MKTERKTVVYPGVIEFDPENVSNKHIEQARWKKVALVKMDDEIIEYYKWFLYNRFKLVLNKNLRGSHVTFINDDFQRDSTLIGTPEEKLEIWEERKMEWNGQNIDITLNLDIHTNGKHWWLNVDYEHRDELHVIREEVGLGRPNFGLHFTLGHPKPENLPFSEYLNRLYLKEEIELNDSIYYHRNKLYL